jgi:mannose/fructose/N-acetylgalactosamine-specific phosphotransferase system component IID
MYLVAIAWIYVVLMMAVAEALSTQGTILGAVFTFALYGVLPLSIVLYIMATPGRRRARRAAQAEELAQLQAAAATEISDAPDGSGVAAADPVAPKREEG